MRFPLRPPLIALSLEDIRYEEDLLKSLKSYRHTDKHCFRHDPAMDSAFSSDFPEGRYSDGLMAFLSAFRGLFPRYSQRSSTVILFKVHIFLFPIIRLTDIDFYLGPDA
jgi:hypothetical protein